MLPFNPLSSLRSLFLALQSDDDPSSIAAGFALGATLGLLPKGNLLAAAFLVFFFFFRVDKGMAFLSAALFTTLGYALDRAAHAVGKTLLLAPALKPLWTWLYNMPVVPWTHFNNTVVMGNLVIGAVLFFPLYFGFMSAVLAYRVRWQEKVNRWPVVRAINGWGWVQTYKAWRQRLGR